MKDNPTPNALCSNCGADVTGQLAAGLAECAACRSALPEDLLDSDATADKRRWRRTFWIVFFATPISSLVIGLIPNVVEGTSIFAHTLSSLGVNSIFASIFGAPVLGSLACGYCLMKQRRSVPTTLEAFFLPIAYGIGIFIIYAAILFVGCLVIVSAIR